MARKGLVAGCADVFLDRDIAGPDELAALEDSFLWCIQLVLEARRG